MIVRNKIDKKLKRILYPVLKEYGFESINNRRYYAVHDNCTWVISINHIGKYYSELSGWPAQSLNVTIGIYFDFIPPIIEFNKFPNHYDCQVQMELCCVNEGENNGNKPDREKETIWWFWSNGKNIEDVINNIKYSFLKTGLPWLKKYSNIERAFEKIEREINSYHKFYNAQFFAKHLKLWDKYEEYHQLFKAEAIKFGE
ncbi:MULTISPECIES: DUF4304 domain-containing protein [Heyndrickxia]|uniref:DUF4304 domain-containing protein n=1 Tax=Heyndrickxia TaxID=2837504 RepID=UPI001B16F152|nr:DUF4304 domain-containing protein [Heyndrickxia oleronia]GIN40662.1 hypothetical protein J19TS1_36110 [Heyndrickxia oleronia]